MWARARGVALAFEFILLAPAGEYNQNNSNPEPSDASLYVALSLYGSAVNITKTIKGDLKSTPVKLDANGKIIKSTCP